MPQLDKIKAMRKCLALFFVVLLTSCSSWEVPDPDSCTKKAYDDHATCMEGMGELKPEVIKAITPFCHKMLATSLKHCPLAPK